ncbi:hypothetical protein [Paraburkholderia phenazinium]|uniref:Uncharacterized protein n=1 Tax=Paraburkholderia phenazinium TaxID=60549 RepID=A0A1N6KPF3_9BURK|nr:hypothetical protein [Paraburkholderia phenazinium]SIO58400.1 hypothetical protein SAMN05444165_4131 [Paraburkholderia phenazinium]
MASQEKSKGEAPVQIPRYRLTEKAYINDILYDPEAQNPNLHEVDYEGIPGHHMEPVNEAARVMKEKHPGDYVDPIEAMTNIRTGTENSALVDFATVLANAMSQANTARAHS